MAIHVIANHSQGGHAHGRCNMQRARVNTHNSTRLLAGTCQFDQAGATAQILKLSHLQQPVLTITTVVRLLLLTWWGTHQANRVVRFDKKIHHNTP